ncbi:cytochrome P450 81E8-like [Lycium ferocissimum]|uniref:cytochrome P450 81E8-like n=1 Tax=Lycium ferocissimum TaxID=112874 RepID=UPI0028152978|nr:cytochrome P450 81E8-like [Lycium ferocissimum]
MELMYYYIPGLFTILLFVFFKSKQHTLKNQPPSPPSRPLFGHLHLVKEPVNRTLHALSARYGDILLLRFGVRKALLLTHLQLLKNVSPNRPFRLAAKHLSYNYTTLSVAPYGDHWRNLRRLAATEIFSPSRIAMFTNTRRKEVMLLLSELMKKCEVGGGFCKVDLKSKFIELAFNTLSMTIAGKRYYGENVEDDEEARKVQFIMREMLVMSGNSNLGDFLPFLQWFDFKGLEKKFSTLMKKLDGFMQDLVDERRRVFLAADCVAEKTMIDHLLSLQQKEPSYYTDELIKGIVMVLIIAGTDTMSISMEWAMALFLTIQKQSRRSKLR